MNIKNAEELGATVRSTRKRLNVTQKELAMTSGTGLRFLIDLEKGKPTCQVAKVLQVLNALGLCVALTSAHVAAQEGDQT